MYESLHTELELVNLLGHLCGKVAFLRSAHSN